MDRTVNVYLTAAQCKALGSGFNQMGGEQGEPWDVVIEAVDRQGGIFIHAAEHYGEEGSGVWMDANGVEYPDASPGFSTSDSATKFEHDRT